MEEVMKRRERDGLIKRIQRVLGRRGERLVFHRGEVILEDIHPYVDETYKPTGEPIHGLGPELKLPKLRNVDIEKLSRELGLAATAGR
jgi:hypothetical protein